MCSFIEKETLAQEIFKNTYFEEYLRTTASVHCTVAWRKLNLGEELVKNDHLMAVVIFKSALK